MKRHRVCIQDVCIQIQACLFLYLDYRCVLYVCVGVYIYTGIHERQHGYIQIHCVRIGIYTYVSVFVRVCVCIRMHIYIYDKTLCIRNYMCLHICTPTSQVGAYMFKFMYVCMYLHICTLSLHAYVCVHIYMYGHQVYLCECICLHICAQSLQV